MTKYFTTLLIASTFLIQPSSATDILDINEAHKNTAYNADRYDIITPSSMSTRAVQTKEVYFLVSGIKFMKDSHNTKALGEFYKAIKLNSSPLGYLYAAFLEKDPDEQMRYLNIAKGAAEQGVISQDILEKNFYLLRAYFEL